MAYHETALIVMNYRLRFRSLSSIYFRGTNILCTLNVGNDVMFTEGSPTPKNAVRISKSLGSPKISHIFHKISLAKIGILLPSQKLA